MNLQSQETVVVADDVAAAKPQLMVVVILAMLLGILLMVIVGAVYFHYQQSAALDAEVLRLKGSLKEMGVALEDVQAQNAALAKHVKVLKGYAIASSMAASEKAVKDESGASVGSESGLPAQSAAPLRKPVVPKAKREKADLYDCVLVGKSPAQQVATLQRCVSLVDPPRAAPSQ